MKANTPTAMDTFRMSVARLLKRVLMFPSIDPPGAAALRCFKLASTTASERG
jgi:hypothetical protein